MDLNEAIAQEQALAPGSYRIQFDLTEPANIADIRDKLESSGINLIGIKQWRSGGLWHLGVSYRKPAPAVGISFLPLAIIPLIAFGMVATLVGISIFNIKNITDSLTKLFLVVGGITITVLVLTRRWPAR